MLEIPLERRSRPVEVVRRVCPYLFQMVQQAKPQQLEILLEHPSYPVEVLRRVYPCLFRMAQAKSVERP